MKKRMWSFGGGMLTLLLLCGASPLEAENLAIRGSTTMYPLLERALEVFALRSPDVAISLSGSGTATGLRALLDGTADLAVYYPAGAKWYVLSSQTGATWVKSLGGSDRQPVLLNSLIHSWFRMR